MCGLKEKHYWEWRSAAPGLQQCAGCLCHRSFPQSFLRSLFGHISHGRVRYSGLQLQLTLSSLSHFYTPPLHTSFPSLPIWLLSLSPHPALHAAHPQLEQLLPSYMPNSFPPHKCLKMWLLSGASCSSATGAVPACVSTALALPVW